MFKKFFPIILLTFVNVIGFTLLIPVYPQILQAYVPNSLVAILYGLLISSYAFFQFLGAPILGSLSDKYGRKPLLFISQLGTTLSWVIFGIAYFIPNIPILGIGLPIYVIAFSRVVDGITGGNNSVASAWISDITTPAEKTKIFGLIGGVFGLGFLIGPALGGIAAGTSFGYLGPIILAFLISLVTLFIIKFYLPESLTEDKRDKELHINLGDEINIFRKFSKFRDNKLVSRLLVYRLAFALVFTSYTTIIILFMERELGLGPTYLGITLSFIGVFSIINQIFLVKTVARKLGNLKTLYLGGILILTGLFLLPFLPLSPVTTTLLTFSMVLFALNSYIFNAGMSLSMPTVKAILTNNTDPKKQGLITGIDESILALGNAISPAIAGFLYGIVGTQVFILYASFLLLTIIILYYKNHNSGFNEAHS